MGWISTASTRDDLTHLAASPADVRTLCGRMVAKVGDVIEIDLRNPEWPPTGRRWCQLCTSLFEGEHRTSL